MVHYSCGINHNYKVLMSACLVSVYMITKNNRSINLILEHIEVYENNLDDFHIGHCEVKVKVTV